VANALDSTTSMLRISDAFAVLSSMLIGCQSHYILALIRFEREISLDTLTSVQPLGSDSSSEPRDDLFAAPANSAGGVVIIPRLYGGSSAV
jgi:hypothetical protein